MFRNYLAAALRNLARNGLYAGITIFGLSFGFAAALVIGLYVRDELSYDRFVPGHERVFLMNLKATGVQARPIDVDSTSARLADAMKLAFPEVEYAARTFTNGVGPTLRRGNLVASEPAFTWVDPDFFKVIPLPAVAGDPASALDAPDAVVLARSAARKYFGRDAPIGGTLEVDGQPMRVTAVIEDLPSNTSLLGNVFGSSRAQFSQISRLGGGGWASNVVLTYVRLKPGASPARVEAGLPRFVKDQMEPTYRALYQHVQVELHLKPLTAAHLGGGGMKPGSDPKVVAAIAAIGMLILLIAGVNFVTLMTARAARRAVEVGMRKVLGAERRDLVVQFMGESLIYVFVALILGMALAELVLPAINAALQRKIAFDYIHDPALLAAMLAGAFLLGLIAGLYPALVLSAFRPTSVLKGGPIEAASGAGVRQFLVVAQFSVLITLLIAAATIYRQTVFAIREATHVDQDQVVLVAGRPDLPCSDNFRDQVRALPGVKAAACASPIALNVMESLDQMRANGRIVNVATASIDFGFFDVYGLKPSAGRFLSADRPVDDGVHHPNDGPPVVINETAARALGFASPQGALGQTIAWHFARNFNATLVSGPPGPAQLSEIVGVVPDFTFGSARRPIGPTLYFVGTKTNVLSSAILTIKLDRDRMAETVPAIDRVWKRISGGQPIQRFFASQFMLRLYIDAIIQGAFVAICAIIAVAIGCLGLFGLSAYTAERRTKEIGVRKAMGAGSGDILRMLLWQFTRPVLIANLVAWPLAFLVMRWWLEGFAYSVGLAPWTFIAAGAGAMAIALATVLFHALRVARAKPVTALRYE